MHDWCISHRVTCKGEEWNNTATITTVKLRRLPSLRKTLIHKPQTTEVIQWGITESLVSDYVDRQLPMDQRDQDSWGHDWHEVKKTKEVKCDAIGSSFAERRLAGCPHIPLPPSRSTTNRWPSLAAPWWDAMRPQWGGSPAEPKDCDAKPCMWNHQRNHATLLESNITRL